MAREIDLGQARGIEAESVGVPGQRTFRINAYSNSGAARLWLEKEQLRALAVAIEQFLSELPDATRPEDSGVSISAAPAIPDIEFHIGSLALAYEAETDVITLIAREIADDEEEEDEDGTSLRIQTSRGQMRRLSKQALDVVSSGRPLCPLCHAPLDGPDHFCVRRNGHAHVGED